MNPLQWKREHQLALLLTVAIGTGIGVAFGYTVHRGGYSFGSWLINNLPYYRDGNCWGNNCPSNWHLPRYYGAFGWGIFGGCIGAAIIYINRLIAK